MLRTWPILTLPGTDRQSFRAIFIEDENLEFVHAFAIKRVDDVGRVELATRHGDFPPAVVDDSLVLDQNALRF